MFTVSPDIIQFQNKANPYMGSKLQGLVYATIVRGHHVFQDCEHFGDPKGRLLRNNAANDELTDDAIEDDGEADEF